MEAFELDQLEVQRLAADRPYLEFIRVPALSIGLYVLPAGGADRQQPHAEDEAYYVIRGRSRMTVGDDVRDVGAGSIIFVGATVPHRFHDIEEELVILVAFGPAEGSREAARDER